MRLRFFLEPVQGCFLILLVVTLVCGSVTTSAAEIPEETLKLLKVFDSEFIGVTPGKGEFPSSFVMGTVGGPFTEQPATKVTLTHSFHMARYEVTQELWQAVMGSNPSKWKGKRNSVEMFTYQDAQKFCDEITKSMRTAKLLGMDEEIRIPSEAEWEYCCRAGTSTPYSFGESATKPGDMGNIASALNDFGWHTGNAAGNDPPVGAKKPNPWGFHDMHGYLREFVSDNWRESYDIPSKPEVGQRKTVRGGSWKDRYECLRSAYRAPISQSAADDAVGLRCVKAKTTK